eukprot:7990349-Pyramimonas_sp.AAC.1
MARPCSQVVGPHREARRVPRPYPAEHQAVQRRCRQGPWIRRPAIRTLGGYPPEGAAGVPQVAARCP